MSAAETISSLWYILPGIPVLIQILTVLQSNFIYKDKNFSETVGLHVNTNKVGKAKALKAFVESQLVDGSLQDDLTEKSMLLINELTRRTKLDHKLDGYKRSYARLSNIVFWTFLSALVLLVGGFILATTIPDSRLWLAIVGVLLTVLVLVATAAMRYYSDKLNKISSNEDLQE